MHLITLTEPVSLGRTLGVLGAGDWLVHDQNAFEIALKAPRGTVKIKDHGWGPFLSQEDDAPTLIMRSGAIGDLLMLTPVLAQRATVLSCFEHLHPIFQNTPQVLAPYPLPLSRVNDYKEIISLENTMELDAAHLATDVFAKALGVPTPLKSYKPIYHVTAEEKERTKKWLFTARPNVAIQPRSSTPNRDYHGRLWGEVMDKLEELGWGLLLFGKKGQIPPLHKSLRRSFIRNLAEEDLPLRDSVAVLSQCDAFCGVDSSFMHFAGALDVPSVSLHGPFPWAIRTAHYKKNTALTGTGDCAGCCWHKHDGQYFPPDKPCTSQGFCVVLATIKPERIIAKIDALKP